MKDFFKALSFILIGALITITAFSVSTNPKIIMLFKKKPSPSKKLPRPIDIEWKYFYGNIDIKDKTYPIVHLRSGHKLIKKKGDKILVGWIYHLILYPFDLSQILLFSN